MQFVSDYRGNAVISNMFFDLVRETFGLNLAGWAARGSWEEGYTCYSLIDNGRMAANVSTTRMTLLVDGSEREVWQIGTVCTRPEYRMQGCARELLERVIAAADGRGLFLFANPDARGLYHKLGFAPAPRESVPCVALTPGAATPYAFRPATVREAVDYAARNRVYSPTFDVRTRACLAELYLHDFYSGALHACDEAGICAVWELEDDVLHVRALYGERPCDPARLLGAFALTGAARAEFDFMPDCWGIECELRADGPDETFTMNMEMPESIAYPGLMRA